MQAAPAADDKYIFVFVRQDLSIPQQLVQSNHATLSLASKYIINGTPNLVLIGVPDRDGLIEAGNLLTQYGHRYYAWFEPDYDLGLTAIATVPLSREEKKLLAHYTLWRPNALVAQLVERPAALKSRVKVGCSIQPQGTTPPCAGLAQRQSRAF